MLRILLIGVTALVLMVSAAGAFRVATGVWPTTKALNSARPDAPPPAKQPDQRKVLYWKAPDGTPRYSAGPTKMPDGRDYVAVHDDEEPDFSGKKPVRAAASGKKILYYRNPMGLPDTSPMPKKDWMGMDYIPVYEGEQDSSTVTVSLDRVQRSGVRTAPAEMRALSRPVRVPGIVKPDERTLRTITLRVDGFIDKLYVSETGASVTAGEPLFRVYSPQMVSVQVDYRLAAERSGRNSRDEAGALQRLKNLGLPDSVVEEIQASSKALTSLEWTAPASGVVLRKNIIEGQMARAGTELYRLANLDTVWVMADVAEQDVGLIKVGAPAKVTFRALPGETFAGEVTFILPELDMVTRTAKVRIEVKNPERRIRYEMFADVEIDAGASEPERLVVPSSAVIDSGTRQVVLVDRGEGRFEPRAVTLGVRGEDFTELRDGIKAGERVVVSANFLIDAESNLKAALQAFTGDGASGAKP